MSPLFFRKRSYRIYFELLDVFRGDGCPLCCVLEKQERALIDRLGDSRFQRQRKPSVALYLCAFHRTQEKKALASNGQAVGALKQMLAEAMREVSSHSTASSSVWRRKSGSVAHGCPVCLEVQSQEKIYGRALIHFLSDMEFWKEFQSAPVLCVGHLRQLIATNSQEEGFARLLQDQETKLNALLDELIRFEATGKDRDGSEARALEWLADSRGATLEVSRPPVSREKDGTEVERPFDQDGPTPSENEQAADPEAVLFENGKLKRSVRNLTERLGRAESRAASLHFRLAEVSEDNKRLEMNCTGADALANGLEKVVQNLKEEIKRLKAEAVANSAKGMS